jgi:hypothetical protein
LASLKKGKIKETVAEQMKDANVNLAGCVSLLCEELDSMNDRVGKLEEENKALGKRLFEVETYLVTLADRANAAELKASTAVTSKLAEDSFGKVQLLSEVSIT